MFDRWPAQSSPPPLALSKVERLSRLIARYQLQVAAQTRRRAKPRLLRTALRPRLHPARGPFQVRPLVHRRPPGCGGRHPPARHLSAGRQRRLQGRAPRAMPRLSVKTRSRMTCCSRRCRPESRPTNKPQRRPMAQPPPLSRLGLRPKRRPWERPLQLMSRLEMSRRRKRRQREMLLPRRQKRRPRGRPHPLSRLEMSRRRQKRRPRQRPRQRPAPPIRLKMVIR